MVLFGFSMEINCYLEVLTGYNKFIPFQLLSFFDEIMSVT
jgi:hypothetical protein